MRNYKQIVFDIETVPLPNANEIIASSKSLRRLKDPDKIEAKKIELLEKAALSPMTGSIALIGYYDGEETKVLDARDYGEKRLLEEFWEISCDKLLGWNCLMFDIPFIIKRSWCYGVHIPVWAQTSIGRKQSVIDLAQEFAMSRDYESLEDVMRFFGMKPKNSDNSAKFYELYNNYPIAAIEHCKVDVEATWKIGEKMGFITPF